MKEFGRLDITYNNAGVGGATGRIEDIKSEDWDKTFHILTRAVFLGIKYSVAPMRKAGGGSIISTSSVAGLRGVAGLCAYSAAKAAVISITESAAIDLGHDRIRVNCICPGGIVTPLTYRGMPGGEEAAVKDMARMQPIPRAGKPEDIAAMALFLASDDAEWITGTAMIVDGGMATGNSRMNPVRQRIFRAVLRAPATLANEIPSRAGGLMSSGSRFSLVLHLLDVVE